MICVLQRVKRSSVVVDGQTVGAIADGLCILLGVADGDTEEDARALAEKAVNLRIFTDENDKMNLSVKDIDGEALIVSNFTLLASYRKGRRPDFINAAPPAEANRLYEYFLKEISSKVRKCESGKFGADMITDMTTNGPVTIVMSSKMLYKTKN